MFNVNDITLEDLNQEIDSTIDKLERLFKLREAMIEQDARRIRKLINEYKKKEVK